MKTINELQDEVIAEFSDHFVLEFIDCLHCLLYFSL